MVNGLTSCSTVKATPSSNNDISFVNSTGAIPKLIHVTSANNSHARTTLGYILEGWFTPTFGAIVSTYTGGGNAITYFSPVDVTPTDVKTYRITTSTIEIRKGDSATGNKWDTLTEYSAEIYTQEQTYSSESMSFSMDGSIHDSDIAVPAYDVSFLIEVGGVTGGAVTAIYVDTSLSDNTNRYLQVAFYNDYFYVDCGGTRASYSISEGYDGSVTNRIAISIFPDGSYIKRIANKVSVGTISSYGELTEIGTLRGNKNNNNKGNSVSVHMYRTALPDTILSDYVTNGTLPQGTA